MLISDVSKNGIPLNILKHQLQPVPPNQNPEKPFVNVQYHLQNNQILIDQINEQFNPNQFQWDKHWTWLYPTAFKNFSIDELQRLQYHTYTQNYVEDWLNKYADSHLFSKIRNSIWKWGFKKDYNLLVNAYNSIKNFQFHPNPNFQTYLDYTTSYNEKGYSQFSRTFLDSTLAFLVHYKNQHVLTLGFSISSHGLLISQIQCKNKKGNRWTYKLPIPYFQYSIQQLANAFNYAPVLLVDANSLAKSIKNAYQNSISDLHHIDELHIKKLYSQPLINFKRAGFRTIRDLRFHYLHQKINQIAA